MPHSEYIRESEKRKLAVLCIHGFLGSPKHFEKFIEKIPQDVAVYNILLNGHNGDTKGFGKASMKQWKTQADEAVKYLCDRYEGLVIIAHSMGTFFAMEAATEYAHKVQGIMLLQSPLKIGVKPRAALNTVKSFFEKFINDPTVKIYHDSHSVRLTIKPWQYIPWIPRYLELFRESKLSRELIKNVEVPTYIFQSKKDELVSMASMKYIPEKENIHVTVLQNSFHFIYDDNEFAHMLEFFYKEML